MAGQCGGCSWSDIDENEQLRQKQLRVESAIHRIAPEAAVAPIWGSELSWAYRNRVQLKVTETQLGFVSSGTKVLAPIENCLVCTDELQSQIRELRQKLPNPKWKPTPPFHWNFLDLDDSQDLESVTINTRAPFRQGNTGQNQRMKQWLRELQFQSDITLELFAGSGNFTEILSQKARDVLAVEISQEAVSQLRQWPRVRVFECDLFDRSAVPSLVKELPDFDTLFLDPPREGASELRSFLRHSLKTVLYVSCDLLSFLRDAKLLLRSGFLLQSVQPVDLFPQTPHVELLAKFER
jgi:23S rRNA (uracil1939-C5)-methyltransferase